MFTQSDLDLFAKALEALKSDTRPKSPGAALLRQVAQEMRDAETQEEAQALAYFARHPRAFCETIDYMREGVAYADIAPLVREMRFDA